MRLKRAYKVGTVSYLKPQVDEIYPDNVFFSITTSDKGHKGRYNGFDLGDGVRVGVFRRANANICKILTKGDTIGKQEIIDKIVNLLASEGFPRF